MNIPGKKVRPTTKLVLQGGGWAETKKKSHNTNTIMLRNSVTPWQNAVSTWQTYIPNLNEKDDGTPVTQCTKLYYVQLLWYVTWHTTSADYGILLHYNSRLSIQTMYGLSFFQPKMDKTQAKMFLTCKMYVSNISVPFDAIVHIAVLSEFNS